MYPSIVSFWNSPKGDRVTVWQVGEGGYSYKLESRSGGSKTINKSYDDVKLLLQQRGYTEEGSENNGLEKVEEAGKVVNNFTGDDIKALERIDDLATLKQRAFQLISTPSAKPMKPEKVAWFKRHLETKNSKLAVIKMMYDLLLSGEGNAVIGDKFGMAKNSYQQRFSEAAGDWRNSYGVRYKVFAGKEGRLTTKEKWFKTAELRDKFCEKVENAANFYEFDGYSDPSTFD